MHLIIIPHGALGFLPFGILPVSPPEPLKEEDIIFSQYRKVPWLIRSHAISVVPSASTLISLREFKGSVSAQLPFLGIGDPQFKYDKENHAKYDQVSIHSDLQTVTRNTTVSHQLPIEFRSSINTKTKSIGDLSSLDRLPDTAEEIVGIASALGADFDRDIFLGPYATETIIKSLDLSKYRVLAFATHGLKTGDLPGLGEPALAFSNPDINKEEEDGLLTAGEILGLKFSAEWIVLSACNTGAGQGAGAEALSGLGRAFFYAGARALLVSNWPVETTSTKVLTTKIFKHYAEFSNVSRAHSLRSAIIDMIDGPGYIDEETGSELIILS